MANFLTVLIADDNAADRLLLSTIVSRQGHRVLTAANGLEALALFEQERPQLVLMDALMPVMDGFEAARRIRRQAGEELVPIIFLTSLSETEALVQSLEAGGDDFLSKPYNRVILEAKIRAMGRLHHLQREVLAQRDLIARHNEHLLNEQRVAKAVFDKVAHSGCLNAPNIRYLQSPFALFNGDLLLAAYKPSGGMHVLLGDFTGHGLPAAIGAMPLAEVFYGMTAKGYPIADILREMNAKLKRILPVGVFCCASMLNLSFQRGLLDVWNGGLPDGYLREMAAYFSGQQVPYPPPARADVSAATLEAGRKLALDGDAARGLPACASCHGAKGEGIAPYPQLIGGPKGRFDFATDYKIPRTIGNYWPYATSLYDYIRRAMPLTAPGSLSADETYAVSAYLLNHEGLIANGTRLDAKSLAAIEMPARKHFVMDDRRAGSGGRRVR